MNHEEYKTLKEIAFWDFTNKIIIACACAKDEDDLFPKLKDFTKVLEGRI